MSAFLVDDITINRVASWISSDLREGTKSICFEHLVNVADEEGLPPTIIFSPIVNAYAMRLLNEHALLERYPDTTLEDSGAGPFKFNRLVPTPRIEEAHYALTCWLYQCSEGDTVDKPLFKALDKICDAMGEHPSYNKSYRKGLSNEEYWR